MNKSIIKSIVLSKGWDEVKQLLRDSFNNIQIDDKQGVNEIGKQYLAKQMAIKELNKILAMMHRISQDEVKKDITYR